MKKAIIAIVAAIGAMCPAAQAQQQTLEQATDSVRQIYIRAQQGEAADQNEVGGWYYRGRHVERNYETALQWWSRAAQQGNALAIGNMALCYQTGNGIAADSVRAVQLYDRSLRTGNPHLFRSFENQAANGNVFAATYLAHCYKEGIGTRKNVDKYIEYLTIAANKGSVSSRTELGLAYYNRHDYTQAFNNFSMAALRGDVNATYFTGVLLLEGKGVGQNLNEGVTYLMRAERRGHTRAAYRLGQCYLTGQGVPANAEQAVMYFRLAAGRNLAVAQWALAECYMKGTGVAVDYELATYYFSRTLTSRGYNTKFSKFAADSISGTPYDLYLKGYKAYTQNDFRLAKDRFKELARTERTEGELWEAIVLLTPANSDANLRKGIKGLKKCADTNAFAKYVLAKCYESGHGVDRDNAQALALYTASAEMGFGPAQCALGDMYFEGRGVARNFDNAVRWFKTAAESGQLTESAASRLAECYQEGLGGLQADPETAATLRQGNYQSQIPELLRLI